MSVEQIAPRLEHGTSKRVLTFPGRPWTTNTAYNWHFHKRADEVAAIRNEAAVMARAVKIRPFGRVILTFAQECRTKQLPDTGACYLWAKAVEDGLVDAGVMADDTPKYVAELRFVSPAKTGRDCVVITIEEADE